MCLLVREGQSQEGVGVIAGNDLEGAIKDINHGRYDTRFVNEGQSMTATL